MEKLDGMIISGKRKTAVAKLRIRSGSGRVFFNDVPSTDLNLFHKLALSEPIKIHESVLGELKNDFHIKVMGGGKEGQIQAARLAIARALVKITGSDVLKKAFIT